MKKDNFLVVVSILEGRKFPHSSTGHLLTAEAKFDGQIMVTDPVPQSESPNFTQELAWPVDRRTLQQHKLQRSSVKIVLYSINPAVGIDGREEVGYIILSLRAVQNQKTYNWYPLLNTRQKGCKLRLGIYVDEDGEEREEAEVRPKDTVPAMISVDPRQYKLVSFNDAFGRYYQLGPEASGNRMFVVSITIDMAANLFQLIPTNIVLPSMPYFFYYSLFGNDVTTQAFNDLLNPVFNQQHSSVRLLSMPDVLRHFLATHLPLEVHLFCGDQLLGSCAVPFDAVVQQPLKQPSQLPVSFTDFYQLHPPRSAKLTLPAIVPEEGKPRLRLTVTLARDLSSTYSSPVMSPVTVPNASMANQSKGPAKQVTNMNADKSSHTGDQEAVPRPSTPRSRDESYSETFQSSSHMDNDAVNGHVGSANVNRDDELGNPVRGEHLSKGLTNSSDEQQTVGAESSSVTQHQLLVPAMSHHFSCSIKLRRVAHLKVPHPVHIFVRYTYLFFGSVEPVMSHPPIEVRRGTEVVIPQSSCTFPFATTPLQLQETFHNIPLIVEVWQRDHQRSENSCMGIVHVSLSSVLKSPRTKITNSKISSNGTRQTWTDWLPIKSTDGSDKVLGDMEVMLSLEDLGPIVQPTVVVDTHQKDVMFDTRAPSPAPKPPVDVRDTPEYKKALELQLWMEEQQALFKAQEQQRLKALDDEFRRKLAIEVKKGAEYERLTEELRTALTSLEKREKVLKASEEQVERFREDLQHKHTREMEKLRDASVRLKEEYDHKLELEKNRARDMEDTVNKMKRQLTEAESKIQQQMRDFEAYKNQLHSKPEVRLQSEINLLTLEKVELEKKLDAASREKAQYRQQLDKALSKLASAHKKEKDIAKAQMLKEKRELEHMRLRYLAAEEKKVISSERRELDELKNELGRLRETTRVGHGNANQSSNGNTATTDGRPNNDYTSDEELDDHILRLIEERDSLLRTGVYSRDDRIVSDLEHQIREAQHRRKSHITTRLIREEIVDQKTK